MRASLQIYYPIEFQIATGCAPYLLRLFGGIYQSCEHEKKIFPPRIVSIIKSIRWLKPCLLKDAKLLYFGGFFSHFQILSKNIIEKLSFDLADYQRSEKLR